MSSEVKPCPFCGGKKMDEYSEDGRYWRQCRKCAAEGPAGSKYDDQDPWNARPGEAALEAECARLRASNAVLRSSADEAEEANVLLRNCRIERDALSAELAALKAASGEEVEVVGYASQHQLELRHLYPQYQGMKIRKEPNERYTDGVMTVAQHQRITAALRGEVEQFKQANRELSESNVKRRDEWCKLRTELDAIRKQEPIVVGDFVRVTESARADHEMDTNPLLVVDEIREREGVLVADCHESGLHENVYVACLSVLERVPPAAAMDGGMVGVPVELFGEIYTHLDNIADFDPTYPKDTQPRNTSAELLLELRTILAHRQASQQEGEKK